MSITMGMQYTIDLDAPLYKMPARTLLVEGDKLANALVVEVVRGKEPVALTGLGVTGEMIRTGEVMPLTGTISGNTATLTLPQACYAVPGGFELQMRLVNTADGITRTILILTGKIERKGSGTIIDVGEVVPNLDDLLAQIAAMKQATANANTAAAAANAAATEAVNIATSKGNEALQNVDDAVARQDEVISRLSEDIGEIATDLDKKLLTKAPAINCEASGSLVTVTDAAAQPTVQLVSHIEPVQSGSGDHSPDNVRPISGWDAVNLRHGASLIGNSDIVIGTIMAGSGLDGSNSKRARTNYIYCQPGAYAAVTRAQMYAAAIHCYSGESADTWTGRIDPVISYASGRSESLFTLTEACYVRAVFIPYDDSISSVTAEMIAAASPTIVPIQTLTASLPETVYGGTLDWGTGVLTVTRGVYSFTADTQLKEDGDYGDYIRYNVEVYGKPGGLIISSHIASKMLETNGIFLHGITGKINITIDKNIASNVNDALAWLVDNGVMVVYELAEPYTIQLTPQQLEMLRGTSNVWSDTGDTDLVYVADTKLYIDGKFDELNAAILSMGSNV